MRKSIFTIASALLLALSTQAQDACKDIHRDKYLAGDNYVAYQTPSAKLTPAPKGYEAVYLSHYGRHGSRWLIGYSNYERPLQYMQEAHDAGVLTERGEKLLEQLRTVNQAVKGRQEELTQRGAEQHQQIAQRMYERFPSVFKDGAHVDAKSSTVIRCILSMSNETMTLRAMNPKLNISMDASSHDMYYIIYDDKELSAQRMPKGSEAEKAWHEYREKMFDGTRILNNIFSSESYWKEKIRDPYHFCVDYLYKIALNMQSTELRHEMSMLDLFTEDELHAIWLCRNAQWYITHGPSPLNGGTQIYYQRNLIKNIMHEADSCLALNTACSSLRFGHEVVVMPTACFMNLNGYGAQYRDLNDLEKNKWFSYRIFPMGSNIQMVFYKSKKKHTQSQVEGSADTLVKFLLNEEEATVPDLTAINGCYYKWEDVKKFWTDKLSRYK